MYTFLLCRHIHRNGVCLLEFTAYVLATLYISGRKPVLSNSVFSLERLSIVVQYLFEIVSIVAGDNTLLFFPFFHP